MTNVEWDSLNPVQIDRCDAACPTALARALDRVRLPSAMIIGNSSVLFNPLVGFCCSRQCSAAAVIQTYDLARALRDAGIGVVGGFHSVMEKECLSLLLRGEQPIVVCLARSLSRFQVPVAWRQPIAEGRLLLLSPFAARFNRTTAETATTRNRFLFSLAQERIVPFASKGGGISLLCQWATEQRLEVWTLDQTADRSQLNGAQSVRLEDFVAQMKGLLARGTEAED